MISTRISTFFLNRNLRPRRLEQFYSVLQSSIDETNSEVVDTPRAERTYVELKDNNSILNFVNKMKKADSSILCSNVIKLAKLNPEQEQKVELKQDKRFSFILRHLEQDVRGVDPLALISCLKALKMLEIAEDSFVMKNLENALVWRSRSASIKELMMLFSFSLSRQNTDTQKTLFSEVCTVLERRWVELTDPRILSLLLLHADKLTPQLVNRLEDRVQDTAEDMVVCDLVNILTSLGKTGRRNMPVLRTLGFHLAKKRSFLDIKQIADILFAFNRVSFKEQDTLERILSSLEPLLSTNNNTAVVRSILTSLGQLKLSNPPVLDAVCDWFDKRLSETRGVEPRDISTLLLTLANLNYTPPEREEFLKKCSSLVKREDFLSLARGEQIWVDIVWSLVNLNFATSDQISSVLENKFFTKIIESDDKYTSLKLLNINAAAQLLHKDYKGASINLTENGHLSEISLSPSVQKNKLKKFMFETLSTLFPPPRFISEDVKTGLGFTMDAEIIVDSFAKPLQIEQYSVLPGTNKPPKELPKGATKVALFINPFQESLIGGGLTGTTNLNVRLAEAKGYRALVLDYRTIDASMKTISRVQKIDALVKQTISKQNQS